MPKVERTLKYQLTPAGSVTRTTTRGGVLDSGLYVRVDGTRKMTANWDAGTYEIECDVFDADTAFYYGGNHILSATPNSNLRIGKDAGAALTVGNYSVLIGEDAGKSLTTWGYNVVIGYQAAQGKAAYPSESVIIGHQAGYTAGGDYNVIIGDTAGYAMDDGVNNVILGYHAAELLDSGEENVYIGSYCGIAETDGDLNVAIGSNTMKAADGSNVCVAIGPYTMLDQITADGNVGIGYNTLRDNTGGEYNTAIGTEVMEVGAGLGDYNVGVGYLALQACTGDNNTAVGTFTGVINGAADGCVYLGYSAGAQNTTSNRLYIDNSNTTTPLVYGEFDNDLVKIHGALHVVNGITYLGDGGATNYATFATDGTLTLVGTATVFKEVNLNVTVPAKGGANPPAADTEDNFDFLRFDRGVEEEVFYNWELPTEYMDAGVVKAYFEFMVENPPVGPDPSEAVVMGVEYKKLSDGDVFDFGAGTSSGTVTETIAADETAKILHYTSTISLTTTGWVAGDTVLMRFYRDAMNGADTYDNEAVAANNDAWVQRFDIEYECDKLGEAS